MQCFFFQIFRLRPYHMVLYQALNPEDFDRRLNYCNSKFYGQMRTFRSDGNLNRHNMHYWSDNNPHWLREVQHQGHWSLNVWCGILGGTIIGPYFFDQPLNGAVFLNCKQIASFIRRYTTAITTKYVFSTRRLPSTFLKKCARTCRFRLSTEVDWARKSISLATPIPRTCLFGLLPIGSVD
mgnify:CR=1 FL=1